MTGSTFRALAVLVASALGAAGCSSGSGGGAVGTGSTERAAGQDGAVRFAACIRGHGVSDFPDPDAKGEFDYGVSVSPAVWTAAVDACKDLQPPGAFSTQRTPAQQSDGLRFARCIRAHGVKDFPDPVDGEPLIDTTKIPSSDRPGGMDILNAAIAKCRSDRDKALAGR